MQRRARRRLVGAIALVVFVVIVLPIIFDREPKPISQDLTIQIPSQDSGRFSSRVLPPEPRQEATATTGTDRKVEAVKSPTEVPKPVEVAGAATGKPESATTPKVEDASKVAEPVTKPDLKPDPVKPQPSTSAKADETKRVPAATAATKAVSPEAAKAVDQKPADSKVTDAAKAGTETYLIALGLFRNPENVKKVRAWVSSAGFKSSTENAPPDAAGGKGGGVKVLAGPFPTRDAAEKAREKLKAKGVDVGAIVSR